MAVNISTVCTPWLAPADAFRRSDLKPKDATRQRRLICTSAADGIHESAGANSPLQAPAEPMYKPMKKIILCAATGLFVACDTRVNVPSDGGGTTVVNPPGDKKETTIVNPPKSESSSTTTTTNTPAGSSSTTTTKE
jgi:hypothetical protein